MTDHTKKKQPEKNSPNKVTQNYEQEIATLQQQLNQSLENERRARADYQNLVRRNQEERLMLIKMAAKSFVEALLQPLDHLTMAAHQLNDPGLNMVVHQFQQALEEQGLKEINPVNQSFDWKTMEAVENTDGVDESDAVVLKVIKKGYELNGEVVQHAKVVVGKHPSEGESK